MSSFYFVNLEYPSLMKGRGKFVASSKACQDAEEIIRKFDCKYLPLVRHTQNRILGAIEVLVKMFWIFYVKIPKKSAVIIQYPMVNLSIFYKCILAIRRQKVVALIHDLPSFRYVEDMDKKKMEVEILNSFWGIIVHSDSMLQKLREYGVDTSMVSLKCFDYLLPDNMSSVRENNGIVFAGALQKSVFLKDLHNVKFEKLHFNLYGGVKPDIIYNEKILYKGSFSPSNVSTVSGEWGMLWDGDSCEDCIGNFGEYLTLIAPHKFSLYLSCGLKIIAWKGSAMAPFIENERLGITISNLNEIEEKIHSLSAEQLMEFEQNVEKVKTKLRHGEMLTSALHFFIS